MSTPHTNMTASSAYLKISQTPFPNAPLILKQLTYKEHFKTKADQVSNTQLQIQNHIDDKQVAYSQILISIYPSQQQQTGSLW